LKDQLQLMRDSINNLIVNVVDAKTQVF